MSSPLFFLQLPAHPHHLHSFPTRRSSDLAAAALMFPFALATAQKLDVSYLPFVIAVMMAAMTNGDRKSTRLNSSHANISYAVFCLKKKIRNSHCWWHKTTLT